MSRPIVRHTVYDATPEDPARRAAIRDAAVEYAHAFYLQRRRWPLLHVVQRFLAEPPIGYHPNEVYWTLRTETAEGDLVYLWFHGELQVRLRKRPRRRIRERG